MQIGMFVEGSEWVTVVEHLDNTLALLAYHLAPKKTVS